MAKRAGLQTTPKADLPAQNDLLSKIMEHAGAGTENIGVDDLLIPRLTILQALSPQVIKGKPEYDPTLEQGQIYDVGMRQVYPGSVRVLIVHYVKVWNEWAPRETQRGIVCEHKTAAILDNCRPGNNNAPTLPNGNTIAETAQFYVINLSGKGQKAFIPMASTQLREARVLNNYIMTEEVDGRRPPIFYRTYELSTVSTSNTKGTWFLWKAQRGPLLSELPDAERWLQDALSFRDAIAKGRVRGDMSEEGASGAPSWTDYDPTAPRQSRNAGPI